MNLFKSKHFGNIFTISLIIDLFLINLFAYYLPIFFQYPLLFHGYVSLSWVIIALKTDFYRVHSSTSLYFVMKLIFRQFVFFFLILYAFIGFFKQPNISRLNLGLFFLSVLLTVSVLKFLYHYLLGELRSRLKGNLRRIVIIGNNKKTNQLKLLFREKNEFGYSFAKQFSPRKSEFNLDECFNYITENDIDEIYCSVSELADSQIAQLINFADNNLKIIKFIPDNKNIFAKKLKFEYYDYIPVLSLRDIPLHNPINAFLKRLFDIFFSILVIVFLLSWLTPLMAIIIRLESKGPLFFKQVRTGVDNRKFYCYKYRSMVPNTESDEKWATKNDSRITKVGKFIRRTSIDELPQFYNVLFGNMSVVGPRPHPLKLTDNLSKKIDKFMVRHLIKPGITGLAQIRGERGEIEKDSDGLNRLRFDIFYLENWSFFLDIKIIIQTVLNVFEGEEKAY